MGQIFFISTVGSKSHSALSHARRMRDESIHTSTDWRHIRTLRHLSGAVAARALVPARDRDVILRPSEANYANVVSPPRVDSGTAARPVSCVEVGRVG